MALPITDTPYRGYSAPTFDTPLIKRIIDELNTLGATGGGTTGKVVGRNRRTTSRGTTTSGVQTGGLAIMDTGASMTAGRAYMVFSPGYGVWSGVRAGIVVRSLITYTTNGSVPNTGSPILDMSQIATLPGGNVLGVNIGKPYIATANITFRCMLSMYLIGPTGTDEGTHYGAPDWPTDLIIQDIGADPGVNGTNY